MKTLDEVITGMTELILSGKTADVKSTVRDALSYLKEYREKAHRLDIDIADHRRSFEQLGVEISRYQEVVRNCEVAENIYKKLLKDLEDNPPLDWEQLKQMEGKPVWVEADDGKYKGWVMVGKFYSLFEKEDLDAHVNLYYFGRSMEYSKEMYGYYWQAYRKERE